MSDEVNHEVVELVPIPPKTVESVQREVEKYIEDGLREQGKLELLTEQKISISVEETFRTAEAVHLLFTLTGGIALETFRQVILPWLKKKYETRLKPSDEKQG
jgi:hypothetical protein